MRYRGSHPDNFNREDLARSKKKRRKVRGGRFDKNKWFDLYEIYADESGYARPPKGSDLGEGSRMGRPRTARHHSSGRVRVSKDDYNGTLRPIHLR